MAEKEKTTEQRSEVAILIIANTLPEKVKSLALDQIASEGNLQSSYNWELVFNDPPLPSETYFKTPKDLENVCSKTKKNGEPMFRTFNPDKDCKSFNLGKENLPLYQTIQVSPEEHIALAGYINKDRKFQVVIMLDNVICNELLSQRIENLNKSIAQTRQTLNELDIKLGSAVCQKNKILRIN